MSSSLFEISSKFLSSMQFSKHAAAQQNYNVTWPSYVCQVGVTFGAMSPCAGWTVGAWLCHPFLALI